MHKYEEVGPEKAIELLAKGKSVYIVIEARAGGFLAETEEKEPCPKYNWARETDEQEENEEDQEPAPKDPEPKKRTRSAFDWKDPEEEEKTPEKIPEKKTVTRVNSPDTGKICALYRAGWSVAKIADEVGCAKETARRALINAGLWKPRPAE